jgi:hypothetical protein
VLVATRDGGIVVRVPPATPSGSQPVVVSNEVGRGERPIAVRRYAAVLAPGAGEIGGPSSAPTGRSPPARPPRAAGAGWRCRPTGAPPTSRGGAIDRARRRAARAGGPKVVYRIDLGKEPDRRAGRGGPGARAGGRAREGRAAARHVVAAAARAQHAARAAARDPRAHVVAADLSPDGKLLAVATAEGNRVALLDLVPRGRPPWRARSRSARRARERAGRRRVLAGGDTLWVLSGDTRAAARADRSRRSCARCASAQPGEPREARGRARRRRRRGARIPRASASAARCRWSAARRSVCRPSARRCSSRRRPSRRAGRARDRAPARRRADDARRGGGVPGRARGRGDRRDRGGRALGMPDLSFDGRWLLAPVPRRTARSACCRGGRWRARAAPAPVDVVRAGRARRRPRAAAPQLRIQP